MSTIPRRPAAVLVLAAVAVAVVILLPPQLRRSVPSLDPAGNCDLNAGPCLIRLDANRAVELSISPRPVPVMQPLALAVVTRGFAAPAAATLDFSGVGMDMGPNRVELKRIADDRLAGEGTIPVCVTGAMEWQAELLIAAGAAAPERVALRFVAPQPARR